MATANLPTAGGLADIETEGAEASRGHHVFISYASEDGAAADLVRQALEDAGVRCWIAPRDVHPGTSYAAAIIGAIHDAKMMVLVFSDRSNSSGHVIREVERTTTLDIPVLPLRIDETVPSRDMEYHLSSRHWLDASEPPLESHLERLVSAVKSDLGQEVARLDVAPPGDAAMPVGAEPVSAREPSVTPPPAPSPERGPEPTLASPGRRIAALCIDLVVVLVLAWLAEFIVGMMAGVALGFTAPELVDSLTDDEFFELVFGQIGGLIVAVWVLVPLVYFVIGNRLAATLGKRAVGIEVCWTERSRAGWGAASLRGTLVWIAIGTGLGLVGLVMMLVDERRRTWHDRLCRTVVVQRP
jgi:uncharacterized RDD family membrane protein YckC